LGNDISCELVRVKQSPKELDFCEIQQMKMYYDNQIAIHISSNLVFYESTKHVEIDCHYIWENLLSGKFAVSLSYSMIILQIH